MTKSEKIKAEIERMMKHFQQEKDALPITTETRTERFSLGARISMCEELLEYINGISDDEPQQLQPISVPFVRIVDDCVAKCWEPGGVCTNPHRDCIGCPKDWNLSFNTYTTNTIEGKLSANPEDWHVTVKPKISEDTTWENDKTTWTEKDEDMLSECIGAVMAADWYSYDDKENIVKWLCCRFGKTEDEIWSSMKDGKTDEKEETGL